MLALKFIWSTIGSSARLWIADGQLKIWSTVDQTLGESKMAFLPTPQRSSDGQTRQENQQLSMDQGWRWVKPPTIVW